MATAIIPEGFWVLDEQRSRKLVPASLTLWVVRDDGERLIWVSVETSPEGKISINSFDGLYGGPEAVVRGCEFIVSLSSPAPRTVRVEGEIPDMGPFRETTEISTDGKIMRVNGEVTSPEGTVSWYEELNWVGTAPGTRATLAAES